MGAGLQPGHHLMSMSMASHGWLPPPKPPSQMPGHDQVVLYLDFDGVLHHENVWRKLNKPRQIRADGPFKLFEHMGLLESLLEPHPDVKIVLSTSWARVDGYSRSRRRLSRALRHRVIGSTFHSSMDPWVFQELPRGVQVVNDVMRRGPAEWLALDDDDQNWPDWARDRLIRTHDTLGISAPGLAPAIAQMLDALVTSAARAMPQRRMGGPG